MQKGQKRAAKNARRLARTSSERRRNARNNAPAGAPFDGDGWDLICAVRSMERRTGFATTTRERLPEEHPPSRQFHEESLVSRLRSIMFGMFASTFGKIGNVLGRAVQRPTMDRRPPIPPKSIAAPLALLAVLLAGCGTTGKTEPLAKTPLPKKPARTVSGLVYPEPGAPPSGKGPLSRCRRQNEEAR